MIGLTTLFFCCENQTEFIETEKPTVLRSSTGIKDPNFDNTPQFVIDDAALKIIDQWNSCSVLFDEIEKFKSNNPSVFNQTKADIKSIFDNLKIGVPAVFDAETIWARVKVLETRVYIYNENLRTSPGAVDQIKLNKKKINVAYNNLILQINKTHEKSTQIEYK